MKVVVHLGLNKTGTTALQTALHGARDVLIGRGALYPDGGPFKENHKLLNALFKPAERVDRSVRNEFADADKMTRAAEAMWAGIRKDVDAKRPNLLILSSEYFFQHPELADFERLRARLAEVADKIEPVLYVREFASHYGSAAQQDVKNARPLGPLLGSQLSSTLPGLEQALGARVAIRPADRAQLDDGDTTSDFLARFVTPAIGPVDIPRGARLNESVSAETMAILDRFRKLRYPDASQKMPDFYSLRAILQGLEAGEAEKAPGARLRPEAAAALQRSAVDLPWLRDMYGVSFPGVDYAAIDGAPPPFEPAETDVETLFYVDAARRDRLHAAAMSQALAAWRNAARMPRIARAMEAVGKRIGSRRRIGTG
jgi:hypothetical protein